MAAYRVYYKVIWHDRVLNNSYYIISAKSKDEARKEARKRAREQFAPSKKAKLSIRTSFKKFLP